MTGNWELEQKKLLHFKNNLRFKLAISLEVKCLWQKIWIKSKCCSVTAGIAKSISRTICFPFRIQRNPDHAHVAHLFDRIRLSIRNAQGHLYSIHHTKFHLTSNDPKIFCISFVTHAHQFTSRRNFQTGNQIEYFWSKGLTEMNRTITTSTLN